MRNQCVWAERQIAKNQVQHAFLTMLFEGVFSMLFLCGMGNKKHDSSPCSFYGIFAIEYLYTNIYKMILVMYLNILTAPLFRCHKTVEIILSSILFLVNLRECKNAAK